MPPEDENDVQGQDDQQVLEADNGTDNDSSPEQDLYAPYLDKFPESLHHIARDVFKEWDGNVTKRIQSVHSDYEPYKQFVDEYEPDAIQQAVQIAEALNNDPQAFYTALAEAYGFETPQQGQQIANELQQQPNNSQEQGEYDPFAQRLEQNEQLTRTLAETLLAERNANEQARVEQAEDLLYDQTMEQLSEQYGEFDQNYVNTLLAQGYEPEVAVQYWRQAVDHYASQQLAPNSTAPVVMGAGGGTPSIQRDVSELSSLETRALVEQMLRQANES